MSLTYDDDATASPFLDSTANDSTQQGVFVPSYARSRKASGSKPVKTWMILAPLGALVVLGGGAMMLMDDGATAPTIEPPASVAAPASTPMTPQAVAAPAMTTVAAPASVEVAPAAPVAAGRQTASAPVARRAAPVERAAPAARVEAPAEPTGPRSYQASESGALEAVTPPVASPPQPAIVVQPLN